MWERWCTSIVTGRPTKWNSPPWKAKPLRSSRWRLLRCAPSVSERSPTPESLPQDSPPRRDEPLRFLPPCCSDPQTGAARCAPTSDLNRPDCFAVPLDRIENGRGGWRSGGGLAVSRQTFMNNPDLGDLGQRLK